METEEQNDAVRRELEAHYKAVLTLLGEDVGREGLLRTPYRVAKAHADPYTRVCRGSESDSQLGEVQGGLPPHGDCEGYRLLFFMRAPHVAFLRKGSCGLHSEWIYHGLSKIARVVDSFSHRLQVQERMTLQIKECIQEALDPLGVMVVVEARHMCMQMRGVEKQNSITTTSDFTGAFNQAKTREEFLDLIHRNSL